MRSAVPFLVGLLLGACARPVPSATTPSASVSHVEAAADLEAKTVALVHRDDEGDLRSYCTGVWVSGTAILTAHHCVDEASVGDDIDYVVREDVYAPGELRERASIVTRSAKLHETDEAHDLALLQASSPPSHGVARVNVASIRPGAFAQTVGHSIGLWWSYSSGDVAALRQRDFGGRDILWVQATTPISRGNSGCGLFDENGNLIGLGHGALAYAQNLNLFVHGQYIDALLRKQAAP
ncbi:MAG: trypsin-like peptidase domain-containing protein [Labilithrix sp.]|nr:trypsin-like peptidase domain-containing protein [Labilithrix sp.]